MNKNTPTSFAKMLPLLFVFLVFLPQWGNAEATPTMEMTTTTNDEDMGLLHRQAIDVKSRYEDDDLMCAEDVLCAMDASITGAVSEDYRNKPDKEDEMNDKGIEMLCRCVVDDDLTMESLYQKTLDMCGDAANAHHLQGKGKTLLMNWAKQRVGEACGRVLDEMGASPPCEWEFAAKRVAQRKMLGVLGYSQELACAWRLNSWSPPAPTDGVAQTLLRHQLQPMVDTINKQLN